MPKIIDIHFPSPTVVVVWSEEKSKQLDDETGKPMLPRYSHYLEVLAKNRQRLEDHRMHDHG